MAGGAKTTVEVDAALIARLREASMPASGSLTDAELRERAARRELGLEALHEAQAMSTLAEEEAMRVAYDEPKPPGPLHAASAAGSGTSSAAGDTTARSPWMFGDRRAITAAAARKITANSSASWSAADPSWATLVPRAAAGRGRSWASRTRR